MWIIFAGVSILMTVIFIFDDVHSSKTHHDIQQKYSHTTLSDKHFHINSSHLKEEEN
jgi:trimethylamine:corrinoid methyltransferase-like protein